MGRGRELDAYCCFRTTKETIQEGMDFEIPNEEIPPEGICSVSETRIKPCDYPGDLTQGCPTVQSGGDFCEMDWAK